MSYIAIDEVRFVGGGELGMMMVTMESWNHAVNGIVRRMPIE
jgi:hypothetical protein